MKNAQKKERKKKVMQYKHCKNRTMKEQRKKENYE
jgi:hypothetical protein